MSITNLAVLPATMPNKACFQAKHLLRLSQTGTPEKETQHLLPLWSKDNIFKIPLYSMIYLQNLWKSTYLKKKIFRYFVLCSSRACMTKTSFINHANVMLARIFTQANAFYRSSSSTYINSERINQTDIYYVHMYIEPSLSFALQNRRL